MESGGGTIKYTLKDYLTVDYSQLSYVIEAKRERKTSTTKS